MSGRYQKIGHAEQVDLLAKGLVTLPPSIHRSGHRYQWLRGHSPSDIPPSDLDPPPQALTDVWLSAIHEREKRVSAARPVSAPTETLVEAVINALGGYQAARGYGHELSFRCPFHEDRIPSFGLNLASGSWLCRSGCGAGRSIRSLARRLGIPVWSGRTLELVR